MRTMGKIKKYWWSRYQSRRSGSIADITGASATYTQHDTNTKATHNATQQLGAGGGGQWISKPLRGLVFKNQVSEEFCCQIVVVLSLFCLILDLIQHHFHLLWCGLKFYQL